MIYSFAWWRQIWEQLLSYNSLESLMEQSTRGRPSMSGELSALKRKLETPSVNRWRADVNQEYFIVSFGLSVTSQQDTRSR